MSDFPSSRVICSPLRSLRGVQIVGTGSYVPDTVIANEVLASEGFDAQWILQRTGIRERRHVAAHEATSDLALAAARHCIESAEIDPSAIDLVILATFTPDMPVPSSACLIQERLGLCAAAMELQSACAGFMYALVTGMQFVATGSSQMALVVGADCNSRIVNRSDMKIFPLFGDGAGAVLLARGNADQGLVAYTLGSDGSGAELLCRRMGGSRTPPTLDAFTSNLHFLQMDGRAVFKWAIRVLDESIRGVLGLAGMTVADLDLIVLHQANIRILEAAADQLGIERSKMFVNLDRYGNTSAGSVPLALDEAARAGLIRRGSRILLSGYGAGLAWGTAIFQW